MKAGTIPDFEDEKYRAADSPLDLTKYNLNLRERRALLAFAEGKPFKAAAREAGYKKPDALSRRMKTPASNVRLAFLAVCEHMGLGDSQIARVFKEATEATHFERIDQTTFQERPDHAVRLKAAENLAKIKGLYPEKGASQFIAFQVNSPLFDTLEDADPGISFSAQGWTIDVTRRATCHWDVIQDSDPAESDSDI